MDKNRQENSEIPQIDAKRRRLTKAGLAVPAVLGTLASRPVLAYVPWKCTISGQVSGNMSGHELETCTTLGDSQSALATDYSANANDVEPNKRTLISDVFPDLTTNYFFIAANSLTGETTNTVASIHDILSKTAPPSLLYAQRALVLLLNAKSIADSSLYPVTEYQAKKLYIAAATHTSYEDSDPTLTWTYDAVRYYIDLLWRA